MCSVCGSFEQRGSFDDSGAVAQLVERLRGTQEVARSTRVSSTQFLPGLVRAWDLIGFTLGGLVAGEGSFFITTRGTFVDGAPRLRFVFQVSQATRDRHLLEALRCFLGYGCIYEQPPQHDGYQPMSVFAVASRKGHHAATIPFAERFIPTSEKRRQFELWRDALVSWEVERPTRYGKGRSKCSVPGCDKPVRGRRLCRSHYYRATGY
jgi:hypothetical protein